KLQIWDILGQKGYKNLYNSSFRGSKGVIFVADITRKDTLKSLEDYWIPTIKKLIGDIPFIVLANKSDIGKGVKFDEKLLKEFAEKYKVPYFITSAKTGENVELAFYNIGELMINSKITTVLPESDIDIPENDDIRTAEIIDKIIDDFCREYNRPLDAMPILRKQIELAGLDIKRPTKRDLTALINRLAAIETGFKGREKAEANRKSRLKWIREYDEK
ncbi:MAG: GTP-binding protein, partial [Thermoplasmata archaeon]